MGSPPPLLDLVGADTQVPLLDGRWVGYANLDGAASTPALRSVAERLATVQPWYASVHRGAGYLSQVATALYEEARSRIGAFVDARDDDLTVITRNTTDAINLLAGVAPGPALVLDVEHHANLLPWQRSRHGATVLVADPTIEQTLDRIDATLAAQPHALLAVTGASNVTGEALPLARVVAIAHRHGARVLVDAAQLLAHHHLSLRTSDVDYVAFSGHKLYAPYGAGALVGRRDWLDAGRPHLSGGGAVRRVTTESTEWADGPARHEAGSPNVLGAVALAAAAEALQALDLTALTAHEAELRNTLADGLAALPGIRFARIWADSPDHATVSTFTLDGVEPGKLAAYLSAEHGIGVRDGRFCAHPLLDRLGFPIGAIRASFGGGTRREEVERLVEGVHRFIVDGPRGEYAIRDHCWTLLEDPRPVPGLAGISTLVATAGACSDELVS